MTGNRSPHPPALWAIAALTLVAFGLRLYRIDADSIWWDEGISLHLARGSWAALIADRSSRLHPPLYFMLLKLWISVAGDSVLASRFFSLLTGLPVVPLAFALARRSRHRTAGLLAAALTAIAAVFVTYAQEVRVYALLPVAYLLMLVLADRLARQPSTASLWAALALTQAAAILLHYLSIIAVLYVNVRLILALWSRQKFAWRWWLGSQVAAVLTTLPWFALVLSRRGSVRAQFELGSSLSIDPLSLPDLVRLVWTFMITGHDRARFVPHLVALGGLFGLALIAGAIWLTLTNSSHRRRQVWAAFDWLLPIVAATSLWALRPLAHPRYTLLWSGALWVWCGMIFADLLAARQATVKTLGLLGVTCAFAISALSLRAYHFDPFFAKQDVRGIATYLRQSAAPGDVVLVPWQDQSLSYYDTNPARVAMIDFRQQDSAWKALADATQGAAHVYVMEYDHTSRDPLGIGPYALEKAGALEEVVQLRGLELSIYRLDDTISPPQFEPSHFNFGGARLVGLQADAAPSDGAVTVALRWQNDGVTDPLKATVQLKDTLGNTVSLDDRPLLNPNRETTDEWDSGTSVLNTYVLPLPKGTPPVRYELAVAVYPDNETAPGDLTTVGTVTLLPPQGTSGDPYDVGELGLDRSIQGELAPGLHLTGGLYAPREARPGDSIDVMLRWQASAALPDLQPALRLERADLLVLEEPAAPASGLYPTARWSAGETVLDRRRLSLPPDSPPGNLTLSVSLDRNIVPLGDIHIVGGTLKKHADHQYPADAPFGDVARLVGYDIDGDTLHQNSVLRITLYWEAISATDTDYTAFVHIVDENDLLVAQHDFPPVWDQRPTSSWRPGEFLADVHDVALRDGIIPAPGTGRLLVGLYDPATLERLPLPDGSTSAVLDTPVHLP